MRTTELETYLNTTLNIKNFKDYCPNGLQIEGKKEVQKIITGVSANQDFIDRAIDEQADGIIVHHGFFWKGENQAITGIKKNRISALIKNDINVFAYHLPLDAHATLGNNINLANLLNIKRPKPIGDSLVWQGEIDIALQDLEALLSEQLHRTPQIFGDIAGNNIIKKIAWCSGGAQNYINYAIDAGVDCYITGEVSEQTPAIAKENNMVFISGGHHATEKGGAQLLAQHLNEQFDVDCKFIDIENIV